MPRPVNPDLTIAKKIHLPATLVGKVELDMMDPVTRRAKYGAWSKLIEKLLEEHLARKETSLG